MREKTRHRGARRLVALVLLVATATLASSAGAEIPPDAANHPLLQPIDAQNWVDQAELTWDAYTQARPDSWNDTTGSDGCVRASTGRR